MDLYLFIWFLAIVFVVAIIQILAAYIRKLSNSPIEFTENNAPEKVNQQLQREEIVARASKIEKENPNRWTYSGRNLAKSIMKGRRNGCTRIMYHGQYYETGLKVVKNAK